jgi:hypothetical protein
VKADYEKKLAKLQADLDQSILRTQDLSKKLSEETKLIQGKDSEIVSFKNQINEHLTNLNAR